MLLDGGLLFNVGQFDWFSSDPPLKFASTVVNQQFTTQVFPPVSIVLGWTSSPDYVAQPRNFASHQFSTDVFVPAITRLGWAGSFPEVLRKSFSIVAQFANAPEFIPFTGAGTPQGWTSNLDYKFALGISAALQQFSFVVQTDPQATASQWIVSYSCDVFTRPFRAYLYQGEIFVYPPTDETTSDTTPDPWYPDAKTFKKYLEDAKKRERARWDNLTQPERRRLKVRSAIEFAVHGKPAEQAVPKAHKQAETISAKRPTLLDAKPAVVANVLRSLGIRVQPKDYDLIARELRDPSPVIDQGRLDEEEIELLLFDTIGTVGNVELGPLDEEEVELLLLQ